MWAVFLAAAGRLMEYRREEPLQCQLAWMKTMLLLWTLPFHLGLGFLKGMLAIISRLVFMIVLVFQELYNVVSLHLNYNSTSFSLPSRGFAGNRKVFAPRIMPVSFAIANAS